MEAGVEPLTESANSGQREWHWMTLNDQADDC